LTVGFNVTKAVAAADGFDTLATVIVTTCLVVTTDGAVYRPVVEIEPVFEGDMDQFTLESVPPNTAAANCCDPPEKSEAAVGAADTITWPELNSLTVAAPPKLGLAKLLAMTLNCSG
jgi:hypothetical protein